MDGEGGEEVRVQGMQKIGGEKKRGEGKAERRGEGMDKLRETPWSKAK